MDSSAKTARTPPAVSRARFWMRLSDFAPTLSSGQWLAICYPKADTDTGSVGVIG